MCVCVCVCVCARARAPSNTYVPSTVVNALYVTLTVKIML